MSYVFDTSSLMAVLLDDESPEIDVLFDEHTVELTFYEAGNVLWKAGQLQERIDADETQQLVGIVEDVRLELSVHGGPNWERKPSLRRQSSVISPFTMRRSCGVRRRWLRRWSLRIGSCARRPESEWRCVGSTRCCENRVARGDSAG